MASLLSLIPLILFVIFIIKWFYANSSTSQKKLPPSPPKLPVIGNLHQLGLFPHHTLQSWAKKYGPIMQIHLGSRPVVVVSSADGACEIMKKHDIIFSSRPKAIIPDRLLYGSKDVAFAPYGESWRQLRSICVLHLLSNKRVQSFRQVREEETSQMIEKIRQKCSSSSPLINLSETFLTLTNDIICRIALGKKYSDGENGRKVRTTIREFLELLGVFNVGDYIPWLAWVNCCNGLDAKIQRVAKEIDEFMEGVIEEHMNRRMEAVKSHDSAGSRESDFVDILLEVQRKNSTGVTVERDTLKALIMDMFGDGTDTTHTVMEWMMAELLRHPKILEKLQIEVREVSHGKSEVTEDDLEKMPYLKATIKETLRIHAPVPLLVARESTEDTRVMGYDISAGTQVFVNAWAIGRDPHLWEKCEEFEPERFLDSKIDFRGFNFELIPFGAGRRGCPGIHYAIAVNELVLAKLLREFNFELPNGAKPEDLDMSEANGITVNKRLPLFVAATPYNI